MREIGVRELKRSLSATLREVGNGEQIRVTSRGRPIVDLVPARAGAGPDKVRELVAAGRLAPAAGPIPDHPPVPVKADRSASELVLAERDTER